MRGTRSALAVVLGVGFVASAAAATRVETIEARGSLQCGGVPRAGLATFDERTGWSGREVEICREVAVALLGRDGRFSFHGYQSNNDFDRVRMGEDDLSFVTQDEIAAQKLDDALETGPTVSVERQVLMVAQGSPVRKPTDLGGQSICFIIATPAEAALQAWAVAHGIDFVPNAFQEPDEMADAYNVQHCQAVAGDSDDLAAIGRDGGINHLESRLLAEPLATTPVLAATPRERDGRWAGVIARTLGRGAPRQGSR